MHWDQLFAILFMAIIIVGIWKINCHYERSGVIFGFPFSIRRDHTPRLFRGGMILSWLSFGLMVAFALFLSAAIASSWV
jgi:hypothetical protein